MSEVVGYSPAALDTKLKGLKGDPLNLSIGDAVSYTEDNPWDWKVLDAARQGQEVRGFPG